MKCDELRGVVESGGELGGDAWEHMESCPRCREEFAHLRALRASTPELPAGLRDRVVEAAFPAKRGGFRWGVVAAAAAVAIAFAGGISIGRGVERRNTPAVEPVVVEREVVRVEARETPRGDGDLFLLGYALQQVYKKQVKVTYDGMTCTHITADKDVFEMIPYCPIARQLWVTAVQRPDVIEIKR